MVRLGMDGMERSASAAASSRMRVLRLDDGLAHTLEATHRRRVQLKKRTGRHSVHGRIRDTQGLNRKRPSL